MSPTTGQVLRRWVVACAAAEALGMTAAAGASTLAIRQEYAAAPALLLVVLAGLVEGTALGLASSHALALTHPTHARRTFVVVTVVVAGLGWAAASTPGVLAGDDGQGPSVLLQLLGGAGLGLVTGAVLGAAQTAGLRGTTLRRGGWVAASSVGWGLAMVVVFLGAGAPSSTWSATQVLLLAAATGGVAGVMVGVALGGYVASETTRHPLRVGEGGRA